MKAALALISISTLTLLLGHPLVLALDVSQYAHTAWTIRDGFSLGNIYAMSQTLDGYLWLVREFGLFRFDGVRSSLWQAPAGQHLPDKNIYRLTMKAGFRGDREGGTDSIPRQLQDINAQGGYRRVTDLKFAHLTTNDGLSQSNVKAILQDHRGFMWFATQDGLDRYDGNTFVVYKHNPNDPDSLSANLVVDLIEDDQGYLWIATYTGGVNKFDPRTERFTRYRHDPSNPNSIGADSVNSIARDSRGCLWFGTEASGLDKFDPTTKTFTHYLNDSDGLFVGRITKVIEDSHRDIWFVGERGLFHLNIKTGEITRPPATRNGLGADYVAEDEIGNFWILAYSPIVGLVEYDPHAERVATYPVGAGAVGLVSSKLFDDRGNGFWVPSSLGLYYFDRRTEHLTRLFQHDESNPDSLNDNAVISAYQDRGGVLWVGTEKGGLNILNFQQKQFGRYVHRPGDPNSLSPGRVTAIYRDSEGILWVGFSPRALDRLDRKTGQATHYVAGLEDRNAIEKGTDVNSIYKDARGYLWLAGWGSGLDRFDERTGQFKHYRHNPDDPNSLTSNHVLRIYRDQRGQLWVGHIDGVARLDPATEQFTFYRPDPKNPTKYGNAALAFYQDRSGALWVARGEGVLSRYDDKTKTFANYTPDSRDPHGLNGGDISAIHEDRTGTLWLGAWDGLYRDSRQDESFTRYTESQGLPSSVIQGILEDKVGRLWLSTKNGISRFDPQAGKFRNYDVSDGLQANEFSQACYTQGPDGEMFFGGSNGFNAFFPENVRDNPYVPPVVITSFKIFNKPVPIGARSVLKKAIPYLDSLTLSYRESVFSFEFAALSYANSQKNRYRYKLEGLEPGWNEVGSKQRLATYTNLDPGRYVFRVQASNSDGVWNEEGVSLPILITPPWWNTNWFRAFCAAVFLALLWTAYQLRVRQLHHEFYMDLEARVSERTRIARDLHDTLLQSFHGLLLRFQTVSLLLPERPIEAKEKLDSAIEQAAGAITEGRDAVRGLRASTVERNDLALAISTLGEVLESDSSNHRPATFRVAVEGQARDLHPILRDEIYKIAAEALRNAFHHAQAKQVEVEVRYDDDQFRLRVRDDGKGMDSAVLSRDGLEGHYGLRGMRERATLIQGKLVVWSEVDEGTEVELRVPASVVYTTHRKRSWLLRKVAPK
jgi:ligand-binding sensor domain-containing protein/signal transduction histidine kinase